MKWTKEQERELNRLCFEEKSNAEIADAFDCALKDIHAARSRLGITRDKVKAAKAALAKDKLAAQEETRARREERRGSRKKLKPCPFCGGEAKYQQFANPGNFYRVYCATCRSQTCGYNGKRDATPAENMAMQAAAWNRRV